VNIKTRVLTASGLTLITLLGCSADIQAPEYESADSLPHYTQSSFAEYLASTREWLEQNRLFITADKQSELSLVIPKEYRPDEPNGQGVLLVHGLGDSPYSFADVATH
ncbi:esterase, partial [Vibrio xuii]